MTAHSLHDKVIAVSDVSRALAQLDEIHTRLARSEVYRGWRSLPVALSGLVGIAAAVWQQLRVSADPIAWTMFWLSVAVGALLVGCAAIARRYLREESLTERHRTEQVLAQFLPALVIGACATIGLVRVNPALATCLPGIWAMVFALGIFSARPYLPVAASFVSAYYALAGALMLWFGGTATVPENNMPALYSWMVGGVFSAGQFLAAAVLYWSLERPIKPRPAIALPFEDNDEGHHA